MVKSGASSRRTKKNYKKGTKAKQIEPDKIK
jgi:hypothetical protein